jgi:hypothetical protein
MARPFQPKFTRQDLMPLLARLESSGASFPLAARPGRPRNTSLELRVQGRFWRLGRFPGQRVTVCHLPGVKPILLKDGQRVWESHL